MIENEDIDKLKQDLKFYKEWYEFHDKEITKRNKKAWEVLAKLKGVKEIDIVNLHEINIWEEIEKIILEIQNKEITKKIEEISKNPYNELKVNGILFTGTDIKQYFERKVKK